MKFHFSDLISTSAGSPSVAGPFPLGFQLPFYWFWTTYELPFQRERIDFHALGNSQGITNCFQKLQKQILCTLKTKAITTILYVKCNGNGYTKQYVVSLHHKIGEKYIFETLDPKIKTFVLLFYLESIISIPWKSIICIHSMLLTLPQSKIDFFCVLDR